MKPVELFHIGPQKSAHTWVYEALREHPGVAATHSDCVYYFDMFYARGRDWYAGCFRPATQGQRLFDATCTYIRSPWAAERIRLENPEARIALSMRNPIERAFSHYWQEKKRRRIRYDFSAVLSNYDLFSSWLEPGFYAEHIERYLRCFGREQILCQLYDDLQERPQAFLAELLDFYGLDPDFEPSILNRRVNEASPRTDVVSLGLHRGRRLLEARGLGAWLSGSGQLAAALSGKAEYLRGIPDALYDELLAISAPEITRLEKLLDLKLDAWRERPAARGDGPEVRA